jgi:hypothetical protein
MKQKFERLDNSDGFGSITISNLELFLGTLAVRKLTGN